jgi:hypothetical protein
MTPEQAAIINFMGQVYGESKKIDQNMVSPSSSLKPTSHVVEKVIREQLSRPVIPVQPPTPAEVQAAGVVPPPQPENQNITEPTHTGQPPQVPDTYIGDPVPEQPDVQIPTPTGPIPTVAPTTNQPMSFSYPPDVALEISNKLDIIIAELQKLNNTLNNEITGIEEPLAPVPGSDTEG